MSRQSVNLMCPTKCYSLSYCDRRTTLAIIFAFSLKVMCCQFTFMAVAKYPAVFGNCGFQIFQLPFSYTDKEKLDLYPL